MNKPTRNQCFLILTAVISLIAIVQSGCDPVGPRAGIDVDQSTRPSNSYPDEFGSQAANASNPSSNIVIGSFNIQMFGKSKMSKPGVVQVLVDVARRFDVLAIQELRDIDQRVIPEFLIAINQDGSRYAAAVGPRQGYIDRGKNTYYEQSVFIYDTNTIELTAQTYAAHDRYQIMHRPPYVGQFRYRGDLAGQQPFSFVLMNIHIDPDDAHIEFDALQEIIGEIYTNHRGEDDFILLGDFNEEPDRYQAYRWMQNQFAAIPAAWKTNTVQTKAYDDIVFDSGYTAEYTGQSGVLNLMSEYQLTREDAQLVSDHMPVWAVFSTIEAPPTAVVQGQPEAMIR